MTFPELTKNFTDAVESGDGQALAALFTEGGTYHDYIYGPFTGRPAIAEMLEGHFHGDARDFKWDMLEPVFDGRIGYARYLFSFTSTISGSEGRRVAIPGMAQFVVADGLIENCSESVNGGLAMAQLGHEPARMAKVFQRWSERALQDPDLAIHKGL